MGAAAIWGIAMHKVVQDALQGNPMTLTEAWGYHYPALVEKNPRLVWGETSYDAEYQTGLDFLTHSGVYASLQRMFDKGLRQGDGSPWIEKPFRLMIPNIPLPILGYIDLVQGDNVPADIKCVSWEWDEAKARDQLQAVMYLYAMWHMGAIEGDGPFPFRHYVFFRGNSRSNDLNIKVFETSWDIGWFEWLEKTYLRVWKAIDNQVFLPASAGHWRCSPKYCDFWDQCKGKFVIPEVDIQEA